eukprot:scaffold1703_cov252-Pinguiococcus_pyrenoidosus.AAC.2
MQLSLMYACQAEDLHLPAEWIVGSAAPAGSWKTVSNGEGCAGGSKTTRAELAEGASCDRSGS